MSGKVEFSMYKLHNFYILNKSLLKWKLVVYTWEIACELLLLWKCDKNLGKRTFKQNFQTLEQI